jgi:hypothetical protein
MSISRTLVPHGVACSAASVFHHFAAARRRHSFFRGAVAGICASLIVVLLPMAPAEHGAADDAAPSSSVGWVAAWDGLLRDHVRGGAIEGIALNVVDYAAIASDARWPLVLAGLAAASDPGGPEEHANDPAGRAEALAFWINAYNVLAVETVIVHAPARSIMDIVPDPANADQSVWKAPAGEVAGKTYSLDEIEHGIVRRFGDARIHAAVNCASVSCPDLRAEAFRAEGLDAQLDDQMRAFLRNRDRGLRYDTETETLHLSALFQWFADDFVASEGSVVAFVRAYGPPAVARRLTEDTPVEFLEYDWRLNAAD